MTFRQLIQHNKIFLWSWGVILAAGLLWMSLASKGDGVLFLNQFYTPARNKLFLFITTLGEDPGFYIVLSVVLLFKQLRHVLALLALLVAIVLFTYLLKHYIFPDAARPISFLGGDGLNLVKNMRVNTDHSFPSGHTTAGFGFFTFLALCFRYQWIKVTCLLVATLVAVSRVYLVQHFVQDVLAGSILGVGLAFLFYGLLARARWTENVKFLQLGLFR